MKKRNKLLIFGLYLISISLGIGYQLKKNIDSVSAEESVEVYQGTISSPIVGSIHAYSSETIPTGYLKCNGQAVSRTTYSKLYSVIGTTYGSGDGSTTFNLPNLSGKVAVGTGTGTDSNNTSKSFTIASTGGATTHTVTTSEMASHTHSISLGNSKSTTGNNSAGQSATWYPGTDHTSWSGSHTHNFTSITGTDFTVASGTGSGSSGIYMGISGSQGKQNGTITNAHWFSHTGNGNGVYGSSTVASHSHTVTPSGSVSVGNTSHTHTIKPNGSNANKGGSGAHNNVQPYTVVNYIIKY